MMPNRPRVPFRRPARRPMAAVFSAVVLDAGHDLPTPKVPAGLFGPPKYTAADQAANPDKPLTRIVKDVLHVGTIRVVDEANGDLEADWQVTPQHLAAIADAHRVARSRGFAAILGKTHGDERTRLIHPDDHLAPIAEFKTDGRVLWMSAYVTPEQARYLSNPALKVSPYLKGGYRDTGGHVYPIRAVHVAVTDNPRVPGQGMFQVALSQPHRRAVAESPEARRKRISEGLTAVRRRL